MAFAPWWVRWQERERENSHIMFTSTFIESFVKQQIGIDYLGKVYIYFHLAGFMGSHFFGVN